MNRRLTVERSFAVTSWGPMLKYAAMQQALSFNFMWRLQQGTLELNPLLIFTAWMQCLLVCNTKGSLAINWKTKADCKVHQINQVDTQSSQVGCYLITYYDSKNLLSVLLLMCAWSRRFGSFQDCQSWWVVWCEELSIYPFKNLMHVEGGHAFSLRSVQTETGFLTSTMMLSREPRI